MAPVLEGKSIGLDQKTNFAKRRAPDLENQEEESGCWALNTP
jgi:hypothetical protein